MQSPFEAISFRERERAESLVAELRRCASDAFTTAMAEALPEVVDPERVLTRTLNFLNAVPDSARYQTMLAGSPKWCAMFCTILDQSSFFTDTLCNDPGAFDWLCADADLKRPRNASAVATGYHRDMGAYTSFPERMKRMRKTQRREILRIGVRDIFVHAPMRVITRELSDLADAMIAAALEAAERELAPRCGRPMAASDSSQAATLVILGMGKLGGQELNFSSDIDLIFVYSEDGECEGGSDRQLSNAEYFRKLGELVIKALGEDTVDGRVYRVDMRLRPLGSLAPLALSLGSTIAYFEEHGRPWERQMLIKARPVAGDVALGESFLQEVRPFVFPKYFDDATLEEIRGVKAQMEAVTARRGETGTEVKLGRGGIRDIEFTVQMLQLLNGGRIEDLRAKNTLDAIRALGRHGLLGAFQADTLASNYSYLREIEHRLQIEGGQQRHALPEDALELEDLARKLGYQNTDAFLTRYRERGDQTRQILDHFFATEGAGNLWIADLLNPQSNAEDGLQRLAGMGFLDPEGARAELLDLYLGPDIRSHSAHIRQAFRHAAPLLIAQLAKAPHPDEVLLRMGRLLTNLKAPGPMYDLLSRRPALCEALVKVISNSYYLADIIIRNPDLFDFFGQGAVLEREIERDVLEEELRQLRASREPQAALYRLHQAQTLRIGLRDVLGRAGVVEVGRELSLLADVCVQAVFEECLREAHERYGPLPVEFAVLGLGKLGGRELGYGSDLDLLFVHGGETGSSEITPGEYAANLAAAMMRRLKERTQYGALYDVDARLRPDGQKGPLSVPLGRLEDYYGNEAQGWERLALVKARAVAGHAPFAEAAGKRALETAFTRPLTPDEVAHTDDMLRRLSENAGPLDLKRGNGGLAQLEIGVRMLQLRHAEEHPDLRRTDVLGALALLAERELVSTRDAETLRAAYVGIRTIENRVRLFDGTPSSTLPDDSDQQQELAARLGLSGGLLETVNAWKVQVNTIYRRILAGGHL